MNKVKNILKTIKDTLAFVVMLSVVVTLTILSGINTSAATIDTAYYRSFLAAGMEDVAIKLYHGGRHEMLNELNRETVYADILKWLEGEIEK